MNFIFCHSPCYSFSRHTNLFIVLTYLTVAAIGFFQLTSSSKKYGVLLYVFICLGVLLNIVLLSVRAIAIGSIALSEIFDSMMFLTSFFGLIYICLGIVVRQVLFGAVIGWLMLFLVLMVCAVASPARMRDGGGERAKREWTGALEGQRTRATWPSSGARSCADTTRLGGRSTISIPKRRSNPARTTRSKTTSPKSPTSTSSRANASQRAQSSGPPPGWSKCCSWPKVESCWVGPMTPSAIDPSSVKATAGARDLKTQSRRPAPTGAS